MSSTSANRSRIARNANMAMRRMLSLTPATRAQIARNANMAMRTAATAKSTMKGGRRRRSRGTRRIRR